MKCWKCGASCDDSAVKCPSCGASLSRPEPTSEIGRAMRMLIDRYGAEKVLSNNAYLVNGLGDLVEDSKKVSNQMKMAMDAGVGRAYLEQIAVGSSDAAFDARVRTLLTEEAGFSDKAAEELAGYFDEMIGWRGESAKVQTSQKPKEDFGPEIDRKKPKEDFGPEIDRGKLKNSDQNTSKGGKKTGLWIVLGLALVVVIFLLSRGGKSGKQQTTTTTTKAETTTEDREAQKAAEKAAEQEDLKKRWVAMHDYAGSGEALMQDDFILLEVEKDEYSIFDFYGVSFLTNGNSFEFARGGGTGFSQSEIEEMYGKPAENGKVTEDFYVYKYLKDFENQPEEAEAILDDEIYRYEFETEKLSCVLDFLFDKDSGEVIGYGYSSSKKE